VPGHVYVISVLKLSNICTGWLMLLTVQPSPAMGWIYAASTESLFILKISNHRSTIRPGPVDQVSEFRSQFRSLWPSCPVQGSSIKNFKTLECTLGLGLG
jgi:hypothetical protein